MSDSCGSQKWDSDLCPEQEREKLCSKIVPTWNTGDYCLLSRAPIVFRLQFDIYTRSHDSGW